MIISSFRGKYHFLSNFSSSPIIFHNWVVDTVEHAYQASKTINIIDRIWITGLETPGDAKKAGSKKGLKGRKIKLREDWQQIYLDVMRGLLREKFKIPELRQKLIDTKNAHIVEGNTWGDTIWGVCNGTGQNLLGKLLMEVRDEILRN